MPSRSSEIAPDVFAVINSDDDSVIAGFGANQGFVVLEESVLVFDTGFSKKQVDELLRSVHRVTDKPIRYVVNSHDHSDHVFGNSLVVNYNTDASEKLLVISHSTCKQRMKELFSQRLENYRNGPFGESLRPFLREVSPEYPQLCYVDNSIRLKLEGHDMCLIHPSTGAHTLGDTLLAMPKSRVIFAGDVLWNRFYPNLEDANLEGWIEFLTDVDLRTYLSIVPGHGDVCGQKEVDEFRSYLELVRKNLLNAKNELSQEQKRRCFQSPDDEDWKLKWIIEYNIDSLFSTHG